MTIGQRFFFTFGPRLGYPSSLYAKAKLNYARLSYAQHLITPASY